jgi:two-component system response regulator YesN
MRQTLNVLIVDDEFHIRNGIKHSVPWQELGLNVIGEAEDGDEAISLFKTNALDIVLLDINMPRMDGMETARYIRSCEESTQIIFLTGYDDFHKVKEAVSLQASDYLLKPIAHGELLRALEKASIRVRMAHSQSGYVDDLKRQVHRYKDAATDQVLIDVLQQRRSFVDAAESLAEIGISTGSDRTYSFICTEIDQYEKDIAGFCERDRQLYFYAYRKLTQEILELEASKNIPGVENLYISGHVVHITVSRLLLMIQMRVPESEVPSHTEEMFLMHIAQQLQDAFRKYLRLSVTIGISTQVLRSDSLYEGYKEALQAVDYRAMIGLGNIIPARLVKLSAGRSQKLLTKELYVLSELRAASEIRNNGIIVEWLEELRAMPLTDTKIIASQFVGYALRLYDESIFMGSFSIPMPLVQISDCETVKGITDILGEFLFGLSDSIRAARNQPAMRIIEAAKQWIRKHMNEDINLKSLAAELHMNHYYLSRLFKKVTNETFLEFMLRIRFEKARELLAGTSLKMHQIAEQIGFNDANYFSIAFKKHEGISPTEYRKHFCDSRKS